MRRKENTSMATRNSAHHIKDPRRVHKQDPRMLAKTNRRVGTAQREGFPLWYQGRVQLAITKTPTGDACQECSAYKLALETKSHVEHRTSCLAISDSPSSFTILRSRGGTGTPLSPQTAPYKLPSSCQPDSSAVPWTHHGHQAMQPDAQAWSRLLADSVDTDTSPMHVSAVHRVPRLLLCSPPQPHTAGLKNPNSPPRHLPLF
jgi:hypothetical protein